MKYERRFWTIMEKTYRGTLKVCVCVFKLKGHLHSFNEFEHCRSVDFDDQDLEEKEEEEDPDEKKQKTR